MRCFTARFSMTVPASYNSESASLVTTASTSPCRSSHAHCASPSCGAVLSGIPSLSRFSTVEHEDWPDAFLKQVMRSVHEPAQVVDELARLVDQHEPA